MTSSYVSDVLFSIPYINPTPSKVEYRLCAKRQSLAIYVRHEERDKRVSLYSVQTWVRTTNLLSLTFAVNSALIHRRDTLFHSNFTQLPFDLFILIASWFSLLSWLESYLTATAEIINRQTGSLRGIIGIWEESILQQILHLFIHERPGSINSAYICTASSRWRIWAELKTEHVKKRTPSPWQPITYCAVNCLIIRQYDDIVLFCFFLISSQLETVPVMAAATCTWKRTSDGSLARWGRTGREWRISSARL